MNFRSLYDTAKSAVGPGKVLVIHKQKMFTRDTNEDVFQIDWVGFYKFTRSGDNIYVQDYAHAATSDIHQLESSDLQFKYPSLALLLEQICSEYAVEQN